MDLGLKERDRISVLRQAYEGLVTVSGGAVRSRRAKHRSRRPRRAALGELAQWDSSVHPWLEDRAEGSQVLMGAGAPAGEAPQPPAAAGGAGGAGTVGQLEVLISIHDDECVSDQPRLQLGGDPFLAVDTIETVGLRELRFTAARTPW